MNSNNEDVNNDNRKSISSGDRSERPSGKNNQYTEERFETERAGPEDFSSVGLESAGSPTNFGSEGGDGALYSGDQSAGTRNRSSVEQYESSVERNREVATSGSSDVPTNFVISPDLGVGDGGPKAKFRDNVAAITLLRQLDHEQRNATVSEQKTLVRYVGWGGLPQAFDANNDNWQTEYSELKYLLAEDEYDSAKSSTLNAHYTPLPVIDGIYTALRQFGVGDGTRFLEPASGVGHFAGRMPFSSSMTMAELDTLSSKISRHLYPQFQTVSGGFEDFRSPENYFDVALGNPPFGDYKVHDTLNPQLSRFSIHNFFIGKSIDSLRPGGIASMVVSRHFLDAKKSTAREYIAENAHFLGAIRLPNTTFKENALTSVTTDIVFFQKSQPGEVTDQNWTKTGERRCPNSGDSFTINQYFYDHPEQIIGRMELKSSAFGPVPECIYHQGDLNIQTEIEERLAHLPSNIFFSRPVHHNDSLTDTIARDRIDFTDSNIKVDAFFITPSNRVAVRQLDMLGAGAYAFVDTKSAKDEERIRSAIKIRDTLNQLIAAETENSAEQDLISLRSQLNQQYDTHVKKYDYLCSRTNRSALRHDPSYPLLMSLEVNYDKGISKTVASQEGIESRSPSAQKAAIFSRRVNNPRRAILSADSVKDALVISLNERGRVDMALIQELTKTDQFTIEHELHGLIYKNPETNEWETAEKYLSGNVKKKLIAAELAGSQYLDNCDSLKKILPLDIDAADISVQFNSIWVPPSDIKSFIKNELKIGNHKCYVDYQPVLGKWVVDIEGGSTVQLHEMWGTERISATTIIEKMMANAPIQVKYQSGTDSSGNAIYKIDEQATIAAQGKCEEIQNAFKDWIWNDPERRKRLERLYNDQFNAFAPVKYDGSHLALSNLAPSIKLRQTQKNAIWRGIQEGTALFDHTVGAGKTFAAVGTIMESRRMGLLNKPMLVVPNNLLGQWKDEFYAAYPTANVLVAEKSDFEKDNRQRLFGQIATGDWDAVIVAHSSFKFIGLNADDLQDYLKNQIKDIQKAVTTLKDAGGQRLSIKELEKQSKRIENQVKKVTDAGRKDNNITFDQLGVDALFVDEADEFKNLAITTSLSRVAGLGNLAGSEKAMDLFLKCRYLQEKNDGRGVYFLTGTPISNSIAELYTMQRYMQYDTLKEMNVLTFDAWASTFGEIVSGWELDATGVNYRLNSRFAKFTNVPELVNLYRSFADVVTQQDLAEQAIKDGSGRLVPKVAGGRPQNVICPRSDEQANYMGILEPFIDVNTGRPAVDGQGGMIKVWSDGSIIFRMENMPDDPSIDNALKVTNDARLAALDFRLKDRFADDFQEGKVNEAVRRIFKIWQENEFRQGTQLVFCDLSTPKKKKAKTSRSASPTAPSINDEEEGSQAVSMDELLGQSIDPNSFSVYDDMRTKLINMGIPANQVRFIHDADNEQKRNELRRDMNNGTVRITFGSTFKMGAGTNYQKRLVALHHLDAPWRPRDLEQREGRIIRQGNMFFEQDKDNFEVQIYRYATEQTYDARMWQNIEVKARGIEQFRRGSLQDRVIDDVVGEAANAAEMKAAATGNELIFLQVKIEANKRKQETLFNSWRRSQHSLESRIESLPDRIERAEEQLSDIEQHNAFIAAHSSDEGLITADKNYYWRTGGKHVPPEKAIEQLENYIIDHVKLAVAKVKLGQLRESEVIGQYRGLQLTVKGVSALGGLETHFALLDEKGKEIRLGRASQRLVYTQDDSLSVTGLFTRLDNALQFTDTVLDGQKQYITELNIELEQARERIGGEYPSKPYLDALRMDAIDVMKELRLMQEDSAYKSTWCPQSDLWEPKNVVVVVDEQQLEAIEMAQIHIAINEPLPLDESGVIPAQLSIDDLIEGPEMNVSDSLAIDLNSTDSKADIAYKNALGLFERSMLGEASDSEVYAGAMMAADAGSPNGMLLVGICHADGIAVSIDYDAAHYWYSVAGDAGSTEAAYRMGEIYEFGWEGVVTDLPAAAEWYKKADGFILATDALRRIDRRLLMTIDVTQLASQPLTELSASLDIPMAVNIDVAEVVRLQSQLNELHIRENDIQASLLDWQAEQHMSCLNTDGVILPSGQLLDLQHSENLVRLNNHLVGCISKAVALRKESGTGELLVGSYKGMAIEVCSTQDALQFKLKGVNEHCPDSLRYEKGVREKFKLPEFITSIDDFIKNIDQHCQFAKQQLIDIKNNINTVKLAIDKGQGILNPVAQNSQGHQNNSPNSEELQPRPTNRLIN